MDKNMHHPGLSPRIVEQCAAVHLLHRSIDSTIVLKIIQYLQR